MRIRLALSCLLLLCLRAFAVAKPITVDEIDLMLRMGDTEARIKQAITTRRLLKPYTAATDDLLRKHGASESLIALLNSNQYQLSEQEMQAEVVREEQARQTAAAEKRKDEADAERAAASRRAPESQAPSAAAATPLPKEGSIPFTLGTSKVLVVGLNKIRVHAEDDGQGAIRVSAVDPSVNPPAGTVAKTIRNVLVTPGQPTQELIFTSPNGAKLFFTHDADGSNYLSVSR